MRSTPSLQSLDDAGRVIYTSTFSKTLSPSLRISFWILPDPLADAYKDAYRNYPCASSQVCQRALFHFMDEGLWSRHLRKLVKSNLEKRQEFLDACDDCFGKSLVLQGVESGLHLWAHLAGDERTA